MLSTRLRDGRKLAWRTLGDGPPLILLHGWAMSSAVFSEVAVRLSADFNLLLPDLPGHGASDPAPEYALPQMVADITDWLAQIKIERCSVLGWSLGGQVAVQLALHRPELVEKLLLVSSTPCFVADEGWNGGLPAVQVKAMERQLRRTFEAAMSDFFARMFSGENLSRERYRQIIASAVRGGRLPNAVDVLACLDLLRTTDLRAQLPLLELPVLVHYGEGDIITPPTAGRYLASQIVGAREIRWPVIGHAPFLSRPAESADLWREFLQ